MGNLKNVDPWPENDIEWLGSCPVCGNYGRYKLHEGLLDNVFFCAPGEWTIFHCVECQSSYLDPRPTEKSINLAYQYYFTHASHQDHDNNKTNYFKRLRRSLANGYRNVRFGTQEYPANRFGAFLLRLFPVQRALLEVEARNLPRSFPGATLLDVGCGNGTYLEFARRAGWEATGIDTDPQAIQIAQSKRLDARLGGIDLLRSEKNLFDGITLGNVIEHLHNPIEVLEACHRLLKPEGWLWIETPNTESLGHRYYSHNWRGLEPPRHLVIYSMNSMMKVLTQTKFNRVEIQTPYGLCRDLFKKSENISNGINPYNKINFSLAKNCRAFIADLKAAANPKLREFITLKAWKTPK